MPLAAALVVGCGSKTGVVTGQIWSQAALCSALHPPGCGPDPGLVTVFNPSGKPVAHEHVKGQGSFLFILPVGRYELSLGKTLKASDCGPRRVSVLPGSTTRVAVEGGCSIP